MHGKSLDLSVIWDITSLVLVLIFAQIKEITIVQRYMYIHSSLTFQQNVEQTNIILPSELPCPPSSWDSTF